MTKQELDELEAQWLWSVKMYEDARRDYDNAVNAVLRGTEKEAKAAARFVALYESVRASYYIVAWQIKRELDAARKEWEARHDDETDVMNKRDEF